MITLALVGVLIGMVVGLRYRVMALLPIELAGCACAIVALFVSPIGSVLLDFVVWSCAVQIGYLATAFLGRRQPEPARALANQH